ncbi:PD40 domain-containing protein [Candidatus Poribacteria bacterium]|nr:PD40 domain-containing protein [Candidatus Poribacteria bacterium]
MALWIASLCFAQDHSRAARSSRIKSTRVIQESGARPRFSPNGKNIIFDRKNTDGFYDVYIMTAHGEGARTLTEGHAGIGQRHNGNAVFHPDSGFIVFVSEEGEHAQKEMKYLGDPGLGLFCNLWATDLTGSHFWRLTDTPIKKDLRDRTAVKGCVNPVFSDDGRTLVWTERFDRGGHHNWGQWRLKTAQFAAAEGTPRLDGARELFRPSAVNPSANYVTAMGFYPDGRRILVAGNLDGQHEYGMDLYALDLSTGKTANLLSTPAFWEEGAAIAPDGSSIVFMSNASSRHKLDFANANWSAQPTERDYWLLSSDGSAPERLTYFNEPTAPEYLGKRSIVAALDFSPDGRFIAGTLGIDVSRETRAKVELKIVLIELEQQ